MPDSNNPQLNQVIIKVNGSFLPADTMGKLQDTEVDTSLGMPDMFIMRFHDDMMTLVDDALFDVGNTVEISFKAVGATSFTTVITGEITALEPEYIDNTLLFTVRGYDKTHRLSRASVIKSYTNVKDSDVVSQLVSEAGLQSQISATSTVHKHIFQSNVSAQEFLQYLARRNGYALKLSGGKVIFKPASELGTTEVATFKFGVDLRTFHPRLTAAQQVNEVTVKGWDVQQKTAIVGQSTSSTVHPTIGYGKSGGTTAQSAFSAAKRFEVRRPVPNQATADKLAKAILDSINSDFIEADGTTFGNPLIQAGVLIKMEKLGTRFSGKYRVTSATHHYSINGYDTHFRVTGAELTTTADLINPETPNANINGWYGVYTAIVTDNSDPEDQQGRVKLKYAWLDDTQTSFWARVAQPSTGNATGIMWIPEVNDEVLVAFENGDFNLPYVIGSLWNGVDVPPFAQNDVIKNGAVVLRGIKTPKGHMLKFSDDDSAKKIEIIAADNKLTITLDATGKKLIIQSDTGGLELKSDGDISLDATGNVTVQAGKNLELKGTGPSKLESSATLAVKGSMVNIN